MCDHPWAQCYQLYIILSVSHTCFEWSYHLWLITTIKNKTAVVFLRTNFNEFHTSITAVRVGLFHYYSLNLNRHQMCPQIWDFDPGHNNSPPCPVLPVLPVRRGTCFCSLTVYFSLSFLFSCQYEQLEAIQGLIKYYLNFIGFFFNMNI